MAYKGLLNLLTCTTRSSSVVTLVRPSISSSFIHSFYLTQAAWPIKHKTHIHTHNITNYQVDMQLPSSFRQPHPVHCPPGSPHAACITSSQSTTSLSSIYHSQGLHSRLQKPICSQILFLRSVFGSIQDCLRGSLTWILAFVCFSFFFIYIYIFLVRSTCTRFSWLRFSVHVKTLAWYRIVSYHITAWCCIACVCRCVTWLLFIDCIGHIPIPFNSRPLTNQCEHHQQIIEFLLRRARYTTYMLPATYKALITIL